MVSATWVGMAVPVPLGALPYERWRRGELLAACRMVVASRVPRLDPTRQVADTGISNCTSFYFQIKTLHRNRTGKVH